MDHTGSRTECSHSVNFRHVNSHNLPHRQQSSLKLRVVMVALFLACILLHFLAVDSACDAYLKYAPPDSQRYPCIFPFKFGNKTFENECALVNSVPPYMVCPVDLDPPRRKIVREGICECGVGGTLTE